MVSGRKGDRRMKLTRQNYFSQEANTEFMSNSQFNSFLKCPSCAMAEIRGEYKRPETTALIVGKYIDSYFENTINEFMADYPEIFKKDGSLKSDFVQADKIIKRIGRDKIFWEHCTGEQQRIMTGEIEGIKFKIMIDSMLPTITVDRKIMADCSDKWYDGEYVPFWKYWGYDVQAAIYQEIRAQNETIRKPFVLAVATKETEPDLRLIKFKQETLDNALEIVKIFAPQFDLIKKGVLDETKCNNCDWCKSQKILKENEYEEV